MTQSKRIFYFDYLRMMAILCVVLLHVGCHIEEMMNFNVSTIYSLSGFLLIFSKNFFTIGVDLFLILSGALLLGRDWDLKGFLSKRIPRIVKPFLLWSLIFSIVLIVSSYFIPSIDFVNKFDMINLLKVFWDTLMFKAPGSAVYWFFWMMLGVYLAMPILNKWIRDSELYELEYFLVIWVVSTIFAYTLIQPFPIELTYFTSPIGFVVLGYYLRYTERKVFNSSIIAILLIVISNVIMFAYAYYAVGHDVSFYFHRYSILEIMLAIGVFCLFKTTSIFNNPKNNIVRKIVPSISMCSYGMYLIHSQIIMVTRKVLHFSSNYALEYVILLIVGFVGSWIIILILSEIPYIEDYVGVK
ncbi:MAG: acyltransferase [Methanobrevibacter sp.]|uniref:acyltransferase n=1 Tax=Methanobrevibacter sp. TaxID=66852 RepID=UPI002E78CA1A|nr:acyltransferase [Methanobrevibacter sp.]MEE0936112.1 acyltransferase [Methanobrevibacter sp.]